MGRLLVFVFLAEIVVMVIALIDCLSVPAEQIRLLPRGLWALLIVFLTPVAGIGSIGWFVAGRPVAVPAEAAQTVPNSGAAPAAGRGGSAGAGRAPDDDPDFLRSLDGGGGFTVEDAELLRMWEADLRRREEELRKERGDDEPGQPTDRR